MRLDSFDGAALADRVSGENSTLASFGLDLERFDSSLLKLLLMIPNRFNSSDTSAEDLRRKDYS